MPMVSTFRNRMLLRSPLPRPHHSRYPPAPCKTTRLPPARSPPSRRPAARGQRLDRFLADAIGTLSRSRVKALIEQGLARRDGAVLQRTGRAGAAGATYALDLPPPAAGHAAAAGDPVRHPLRGRRPDRARQAGRPGRASRARQPGRHAGQRAAGALRRQLHRHRRRAAAGHRASAGQGHLRRHGGGQDPAGATPR